MDGETGVWLVKNIVEILDTIYVQVYIGSVMKRMDLRTARIRKHLSQADLAEASGVQQPIISRLETGKTEKPEWETVRRLAEALDVDPRVLKFGPEAVPA